MRRNYRRKYFRRRYFRTKRRGTMSRRIAFANNKVKPSRFQRRAFAISNVIAEKKFFTQTNSAGVSISSSWTNISLASGINAGTLNGARVGNKIFSRYIVFRGIIFQNGSNNTLIRMCLVQPRIQGVTPSLPQTGFVGQWDLNSWTVFWDRNIVLGNPQSEGNQNTGQVANKPFNFKMKLMKSWEYADGNASLPLTTTPYLYFYANDNLVPYPNLTYSYRITYTDI